MDYEDSSMVSVAAALASPARMTMLLALLDGQAHAANDLAREAGVALSTASGHLAALVEAGLVSAARSGRRRDFRLRGQEVAHLIELLGEISPAGAGRRRQPSAADPLRDGRTCYDHLAGRLGIALTDALVVSGAIHLEDGGYTLGDAGADVFDRLGVSVDAARQRRRGLAVACLDWTERRHHLGGALGAALCERLISAGWVRRASYGRGASLTTPGDRGLRSLLGEAWQRDRGLSDAGLGRRED